MSDEATIRARVMAEQKARMSGINDLFAMFGGRYQALQAQCVADPDGSLEMARERLLNEMGKESSPTNKNTPAQIYAGNGNLWETGSARRCWPVPDLKMSRRIMLITG